MYFAGEAAQNGYPFPGNLGLGHQQNDGQGRTVELGSGGGDLLWLTRAPGAWDGTLCGEDHLWAGVREEGRSPSQGLAKGTFSDSVTATAAAGTYRIRYKAPRIDTYRWECTWVLRFGTYLPTSAVSALYLCIFSPRIERNNKESTTPPIHPIPSHPTRPCPLAWDNVISPDSNGCWPSNTQSTR